MRKILLLVGVGSIVIGSVAAFATSENAGYYKTTRQTNSSLVNCPVVENSGISVYRNRNSVDPSFEKLPIEVQRENVEAYLAKFDEKLVIGDSFIYEDSETYFSIMEQETGKGAMELLVDPYSGTVYPEYGPNMMWNVKYGMMSGNVGTSHGMMFSGFQNNMRGINFNNQESAPLSDAEIKQALAEYIAKFDLFSVTNYEDAHEFYGYSTYHLKEGNQVVGMLSVNHYTGEVWFHNWHGTLIEVIEND